MEDTKDTKDTQEQSKKIEDEHSEFDSKFIEYLNEYGFGDDTSDLGNTPGFRLYENVDTSEIDEYSLKASLDSIKSLITKNHRVEVVEDLDVTDVTSDERYTIRIKNIATQVEYRIGLNKFREQLLDYDFEPDEFVRDILMRIDGVMGNYDLMVLTELILDFLSYAIHYKQLFRYEYSTIGWDKIVLDRVYRVFKYDNIISNSIDIKGTIKEKSKQLYIGSSSEYKDEWLRHTINLMNNHVYDGLLFAVGISGLVRQVLTFTKETNINVNILGKPGSGKSTIGHYILSFFGNPILLEGASIDTENASEKIRAERPVLPYVLDERMLRFFADSENKQKTEVLIGVFREYEGKEKERLGKQYENSKGQRIYGPIVSSSVDSMLDMLISVKKDLGQYRRFIEFDIGKAEDKVLFDKKEAGKSEEIANRCYGYGVRFVVEYMLHKFDENDNYFMEEFERIENDMVKRLEAAQQTYNLGNLTSSAKRFALIVLSYNILREALVYSIYLEILERKEILNNNSAEAMHKKIEIFNKCGDNEEIVEQIKEFNMTFEQMVEHENKDIGDLQLLSNKKDEIIYALIRNLVEKMQKVNVINVASETSESLKDYIIKNKIDNPEYFCSSYGEFDATKHLFVYKSEGDKITIEVPRAYRINEILFDSNRLSFDEILANIEINEKGNLKLKNTWKNVYSLKRLTLSKAETPKSVQFIPSKDGSNKKTIAKPKKQVTFDILVINKQSIEQSSEEGSEQSSEEA